MTSNAAERLHKEKFEACVLSLRDGADAVMEAARTSRSNSRCVIYGVGGNAQEAMRYSKYGINAMFHEPLERPAALETRARHANARAARIPPLRPHPGHDRGLDRRRWPPHQRQQHRNEYGRHVAEESPKIFRSEPMSKSRSR